MSIKDTYRFGALVTAKLSKERCIFLIVGGRHFKLHEGMIEGGVGPPQLEKHIPSKWVDQTHETWIIDMESPKPNSLEKKMGHNLP
jgi:hypothetical protein